jgi:hypothetical protein
VSSDGTKALGTLASTRRATCRLQVSKQTYPCIGTHMLIGDSGITSFAASIVLSRILLTDFLTFLTVSVTAALASLSGDTEPVLNGQ